MSKDVIILLSILVFIVIGILGAYYFSRIDIKTTVWVDKQNGGGPYQLRTGSREEEEKLMEKHYDDEIIRFKEKPSEHEVIFTTAKGLLKNEEFHQSDRVPEVKY